jgi:hypothetical protein
MERVKYLPIETGMKIRRNIFAIRISLHRTKKRVSNAHVIAKSYPIFDVKISLKFS